MSRICALMPLVVVSPGIPPDAPVLGDLRARNVRWISEPELAVRFYAAPLIAVTGTNGKTTTTLLVGHLLSASGMDAAVGGNVGGGLAPAASDLALRETAPDFEIVAVDKHLSISRIIQAGNEVSDGCLAGAARTDQGNQLTRFDGKERCEDCLKMKKGQPVSPSQRAWWQRKCVKKTSL